jgi:hypothetical protein
MYLFAKSYSNRTHVSSRWYHTVAALLLALMLSFTIGCVVPAHAAHGTKPKSTATTHHVIYYYQTLTDLSPVIDNLNPATGKPYATDIFVSSFHLGPQSDGTNMHLNDYPPDSATFDGVWQQLATLQSMGVKIHMMLGGAACCSYDELFNNWNTLYPVLKQTIQTYHFDGIDLDIEQSVTLQNVEQLISQLHTDFGPNFEITLAPVATDLTEGYGLSGFNYKDLYQSPEGADIAWFNTQFYSGFGSLASTADYVSAINNGFPANKVVAGMLGNPNDGGGYVDVNQVATTVQQLTSQYPTFAGVFSWEYFDTLPGGTANPEQWSQLMSQSMGD